MSSPETGGVDARHQNRNRRGVVPEPFVYYAPNPWQRRRLVDEQFAGSGRGSIVHRGHGEVVDLEEGDAPVAQSSGERDASFGAAAEMEARRDSAGTGAGPCLAVYYAPNPWQRRRLVDEQFAGSGRGSIVHRGHVEVVDLEEGDAPVAQSSGERDASFGAAVEMEARRDSAGTAAGPCLAVVSQEFSAGHLRRRASVEEETRLEALDQESPEQDEALAQQEPHVLGVDACPAMDADGVILQQEAEEFNGQEALEQWTRAQLQAIDVAEAESSGAFEERQEEELMDLATAENAERHHMMRVLQTGAKYLLQDEVDEIASYEELVSIHNSIHRLKEIVERGMNVIHERERQEMLREKAEALRVQNECKVALAAELREMTRLRQEKDQLREKLEQARERILCRICFERPRDAISLPCMHLDYCNLCLQKHQLRKNTCPTCRGTISGVLRYSLSLD